MIRLARPADAPALSRFLEARQRADAGLFWGLPVSAGDLERELDRARGCYPLLVSSAGASLTGFGFVRPVAASGPMRFLALTGAAFVPGIPEAEADKLLGLLESAARQMHMVILATPVCASQGSELRRLAARGFEPAGRLGYAGLVNGVWKEALWLSRKTEQPERAIALRWEPRPFAETEIGRELERE